jgi:superoxide dismutase, Fe-Mn family
LDTFKARLAQAISTVHGPGWVALVWDRLAGRLILDAWVHMYYRQYENVGADYVTAIWNLANWSDVDRPGVTATPGALA